jgi:peroxiredoxin
LRDEIEAFRARGAQIVCVAPHGIDDVREIRERDSLPFPVLANEDRDVFRAYDVASTLLSLGQRPAVFVVDAEGDVRFAYVGTQQWDIPENARVLECLDRQSA